MSFLDQGRYQGKLYRALNPVYAREPLSGRGAELYGGRFNPRGVPALYLPLSVMTALREANQVGNLQPTTLVSYDAEIEDVFDCGDESALGAQGMNTAGLAAAWREQMKTSGESRTQAFARRLIAASHNGMLVRSFAPGASTDDLNLVLWKWGDKAPSRLTLIDDENRLSRRRRDNGLERLLYSELPPFVLATVGQ
ncbi:RES domain-containing protein [Mesorhizobium sp.]|uniref:RES family NAD+ phosphorylase n=1 Tax=Mesorhizobium sp. TaxID=1871066 RepID=UPI000FE78BD7|nr:RES domain-containing protein [Mesorhizobium sp.]RWK66828.1 MAG: RES domain-containing protein [Mesorhizobium sp.]